MWQWSKQATGGRRRITNYASRMNAFDGNARAREAGWVVALDRTMSFAFISSGLEGSTEADRKPELCGSFHIGDGAMQHTCAEGLREWVVEEWKSIDARLGYSAKSDCLGGITT